MNWMIIEDMLKSNKRIKGQLVLKYHWIVFTKQKLVNNKIQETTILVYYNSRDKDIFNTNNFYYKSISNINTERKPESVKYGFAMELT